MKGRKTASASLSVCEKSVNGRKMPCLSVCEKKRMKRTRGPTKSRMRNWADLNPDLLFLILMKVGEHNTIDLTHNAQNVCSSWRKVAKDARLYRRVVLQETRLVPLRILPRGVIHPVGFPNFAKEIVDRSCGQMEKFSIDSVIAHKKSLIEYIVQTNSNSLKSLQMIVPFDQLPGVIEVATKGFPLLEVLDLRSADSFHPKLIKQMACSFKKLKYLGLHFSSNWRHSDTTAVAIGKYMTQLHRLHLYKSSLTNHGLEAILNGCQHLEYLDLRGCRGVDLEADSLKKCVTRMKLQVHSVGERITFSKCGGLEQDLFAKCLMCWQFTLPPCKKYTLKPWFSTSLFCPSESTRGI